MSLSLSLDRIELDRRRDPFRDLQSPIFVPEYDLELQANFDIVDQHRMVEGRESKGSWIQTFSSGRKKKKKERGGGLEGCGTEQP